MAAQLCTGAAATTETMHGTAATMDRAQPPTARMELRGLAPPTIRQPGLTRVVRRCQGPTGTRQLAKHTTQGRERMQPRVKPRTPLAATGVRLIPRMAKRPTLSTKAQRMVPRDQSRLPTVAEALPPRA